MSATSRLIQTIRPAAGTSPGPAAPPAEVQAVAANATGEGYGRALSQLQETVLRETTVEKLRASPPDAPIRGWVRKVARKIVDDMNDQAVKESRRAFELPDAEILRQLLDEMFEMGPLTDLMRLEGVEDIAINGPNDVWYKRCGRWERANLCYPTSQTLENTLNNFIAHTGRSVKFINPIVDATLPGGHRINVVTAPLADPWPVASIRIKREQALVMQDLVARGGDDRQAPPAREIPDYFAHDQGSGIFTALAATFLHMAVNAGYNIAVVGATGVGKTTVLSALGRMIPEERRILIIEDVAELNMRSRGPEGEANNCVRFVTRAESPEGLAAIGQDALVRAALRQRPDALCVGEARGGEVFDLLKSLRTGHRNGLTSIHADSIEDLTPRIQMMMQEAKLQTRITNEEIALWIAKAFQLAIMLRLTETGRRFVSEVTEFTGGVEGNVPVRTPLFVYDEKSRKLVCTGRTVTPQHDLMLRQAGYPEGYGHILTAAHGG